MSFERRIKQMVSAVENADAQGVGACFTPDGVYHDVFYGDFEGRANIADMIANHFLRDASDFRWDIHDAIEQDGIGYARYVFSYLPAGEATSHGRAIFEGVAICRMKDGLIADYREVANAAVGLHCIGFPPERLAKFIARQRAELERRPEAARHIS
ncbi:MAG: nuclear transport factor 2 family protein [Alphaproteobacteria bacterium]|nr:nuclear transport factor 2 family protein [Alphaproteobacteria bacterium]